MKLSEIYTKPLKEVLDQDCEVVDQKIHTDENGVIQAIEVKYKPLDDADLAKIKVAEGLRRK